MIINVLFVLLFFVLLSAYGWVVALSAVGSIFFFHMFLMLSVSFYRDLKYRDEFLACTNAILANNEEMVDSVNRWTVHFYVHKAFYMSSGDDGLDVGYYYSLRERPRKSDFGSGGGDIGYIWF